MNTTAKHTPGPVERAFIAFIEAVVAGKRGDTRAEMAARIAKVESDNTDLVAALRDLLQAADETAAFNAVGNRYDIPRAALDRARAALAKAEGGQS